MSDGTESPLCEDVVIRLGGWDRRYARVLLIEHGGGYALVLVDGSGDGAELELEYWRAREGTWHGEVSAGYSSLASLGPADAWITGTGELVCAVGRVRPGSVVLVTYGGRAYRRQASRFGVWGFIRQADSPHAGELPVTSATA